MRALLLLGAHLGFVLEVDVAPPAEQDQRDVERQRGARDADVGAEIALSMRRLWKKALPFQISSITAVMRTTSTSASRRALSTPDRRTFRARSRPTRHVTLRYRRTLKFTLVRVADAWILMLASPPDWLCVAMVRTAGFEPALPYGKRILSPQRLPFRHVRLLGPGDGSASRAIRRSLP